MHLHENFIAYVFIAGDIGSRKLIYIFVILYVYNEWAWLTIVSKQNYKKKKLTHFFNNKVGRSKIESIYKKELR